MAAKKRVVDPTYRMWLVGGEDVVVMVRMSERIFRMAHATLSNASRRASTLKAQSKVIEAFVDEYSKQHDEQIGDVVTWKALKIERVQSTTAPRR